MDNGRTSARLPKKLKNRLKRAAAKTPQGESAVVRAALEEFFEKHPTPADIIGAVIRSHAKGSA